MGEQRQPRRLAEQEQPRRPALSRYAVRALPFVLLVVAAGAGLSLAESRPPDIPLVRGSNGGGKVWVLRQ